MGRKATPKPKPAKPSADDREQHARFVTMAREIGTDESPESFDRAFKQVTVKTSSKQR